MILIPKVFFLDHEARDLPTPVIHKTYKGHFLISEDDPAFAELLNDAEYYVDGNDCDPSLKTAARALVRAMTINKRKSK